MDRRPNALSMTTGALRQSPLTGAQILHAQGAGGTTSPTRRAVGAQRNNTDHVALLLGGAASAQFRRATPATGATGQRAASIPASPSVLRGTGGGSRWTAGTPLTAANRAASFASSTQGIGSLLSPEQKLGLHGATAMAMPSGTSGNTQAIAFQSTALHTTGKSSVRPLLLTVGSGCTQGFRPTMEDAHFEMLNVKSVAPAEGAGGSAGGGSGSTNGSSAASPAMISIVGILDGHCGRRVADLGAHMVPDLFLSHPLLASNPAQALVDAVALADKAIYQQIHGEDGGSTLITAVVHGRTLIVANLGDARCVLCEGVMAIPMSVDHKPTDPAEQLRVRRCGGTVQLGRIGGCLAVSRALGDFEFKVQGPTFVQREFQVSNVADIRHIAISDAARFLILACDGLWDVMSNEEAVTWVNQYLARANIPAGASEGALKTVLTACATSLAEYAVQKGSMDNVSVVILTFHAWQGTGR